VTNIELSARFDQLRDYVDAAVTVIDPANTLIGDHHDRIALGRPKRVGRHRVLMPLLAAVAVAVVAVSVIVGIHARTTGDPAAPLYPITSAQEAIRRAMADSADVVSVIHSRARLTTFAAMISIGYGVTSPPPGYAPSQRVWAVGLQGVIKHQSVLRGYTYDWEIVLSDPATGSVLDVSAGDGPLPTF
jgi:hypothetical protein